MTQTYQDLSDPVARVIELERQSGMAKKKDRAFFTCPGWNDVAGGGSASGPGTPNRGHDKVLAAIKAGQPVARSTLRKALLAVRQASGSVLDVDAYIVDQRAAKPR